MVLSLSLRTVAVSDYLARCCPDFPLLQAIVFQAHLNYTTNWAELSSLGANPIFTVAAMGVMFYVFNDLGGDIAVCDFLDTETW